MKSYKFKDVLDSSTAHLDSKKKKSILLLKNEETRENIPIVHNTMSWKDEDRCKLWLEDQTAEETFQEKSNRKDAQIPFKKRQNLLQNRFSGVKSWSRKGDGVTGFHLSIDHCT